MAETERLLGEISSDLKHVIANQNRINNRLDRHSNRIDLVEKFQYKIMGMALLLPFALSGLSSILPI